MAEEKFQISIRRANSNEAKVLTQLALQSKAHWPYPKDYLEKCIHALEIDQDYIENWPVYAADIQNKPVGFFALKMVNQEPRLDHLWIIPECIGRDIGSQLFKKAVIEARKLGWDYFRLAADPYALGFYEKMGATKIGTVQSKVKPDLFLPHMEYVLDKKKDNQKNLELIKPASKAEILKKSISNLKNSKAKTSIKKVGRSRNQKGHKNY